MLCGNLLASTLGSCPTRGKGRHGHHLSLVRSTLHRVLLVTASMSSVDIPDLSREEKYACQYQVSLKLDAPKDDWYYRFCFFSRKIKWTKGAKQVCKHALQPVPVRRFSFQAECAEHLSRNRQRLCISENTIVDFFCKETAMLPKQIANSIPIACVSPSQCYFRGVTRTS